MSGGPSALVFESWTGSVRMSASVLRSPTPRCATRPAACRQSARGSRRNLFRTLPGAQGLSVRSDRSASVRV